jgi:hypothetical protein
MTGQIAQSQSGLGMSRGEMRLPVFLGLLASAWLLVAGQLIAEFWAATAITMPDTDDAMRLVEVRQFLAGGFFSWFDLHEPRLGLAPGYDTHWSRLVDAGLAGLFLLFRIFANDALAERLMLAVWPLLWLIPVIGGAAAIAWRLAGRQAAIIVLLLAIFSGPGIQQFRPARIDHHNVQIALSILVVAATIWSDRMRWTPIAAGALTGLALAVGFEGLPFLVLCGVAFTMRFVLNGSGRLELRDYGLALAAGMFAAFLLSVPPARWMAPACDAIAVNSTAAVMIAGLGLALAASLSASASGAFPRVARLGIALVPGILALAIFAVIEPRCLGGHYALVDPAVRPIWLDNVSETQPLSELIRQAAATGLAMAAFPVAALVAALMLARDKNLYRAFGPLAALAALVMAVAYMASAVRGHSSAIWLGMPFVAAALCQLFTRMKLDNLALRFAAALFVTPMALTLGAITLASAAGQPELVNLDPPGRAGCISKPNYRALADLPPGLMAINDLEWAPYMLAWTPHSALAAPYHRLSPSIVLSYRIFTQPPEIARRLVAQAGAAYIVLCGQRGTTGLSDRERQLSLWAALQSGRPPDWLEPVLQDPASGFKVWRVKR